MPHICPRHPCPFLFHKLYTSNWWSLLRLLAVSTDCIRIQNYIFYSFLWTYHWPVSNWLFAEGCQTKQKILRNTIYIGNTCFGILGSNRKHFNNTLDNKAIYIIYSMCTHIQYIPRNMHTVFALLCFVVVIHWLTFPYPSGLLHWHCGNLTIAPVPAKQPWWIWINTSCEFIMNDCITTAKQSTTKTCAYFLGYTVHKPDVA